MYKTHVVRVGPLSLEEWQAPKDSFAWANAYSDAFQQAAYHLEMLLNELNEHGYDASIFPGKDHFLIVADRQEVTKAEVREAELHLTMANGTRYRAALSSRVTGGEMVVEQKHPGVGWMSISGPAPKAVRAYIALAFRGGAGPQLVEDF